MITYPLARVHLAYFQEVRKAAKGTAVIEKVELLTGAES
jgi:hypothetical protein